MNTLAVVLIEIEKNYGNYIVNVDTSLVVLISATIGIWIGKTFLWIVGGTWRRR